ncbi:conserved hypothetical protein [Neospora caninum Liverpool]|uniref:Transmembrane protein n=1 Tax=Neospora caninum (strain Liverpool) TaxID=572307 RepID=F0VRU4_NEOCL|nr:conserved hypothetical protein [Neospora caninum Liverpool]CBZ56442.1 conserved hypothetical protein [Neospora caninum Liverpool]|eukprot:XP_003886467.1 conserved hypothetical protein [Neospora caninum Liverpool]
MRGEKKAHISAFRSRASSSSPTLSTPFKAERYAHRISFPCHMPPSLHLARMHTFCEITKTTLHQMLVEIRHMCASLSGSLFFRSALLPPWVALISSASLRRLSKRDVVSFVLLRHCLAFTVAFYRAVADGTSVVLSFFVPSFLLSRSAIPGGSTCRAPLPAPLEPMRCVGSIVSAVDDTSLEVDSLRDPSEQAAEVASDIASLTRSALGSPESLPSSLQVTCPDRSVPPLPHQSGRGERSAVAQDAPPAGFDAEAEPAEEGGTHEPARTEMVRVPRQDTRGREIAPVILKLLTECAVYPLLTVATRMVVIEGPPYSPTPESLSWSSSLPAPLAAAYSFFVPRYLHVTMLEMVRLTYAADGVAGFYGGLLPFLLSRCVDDSAQALMRLFVVENKEGKKEEKEPALRATDAAAMLARRTGAESAYSTVWARSLAADRREDDASSQLAIAPPFARRGQAGDFERNDGVTGAGIPPQTHYQIPRGGLFGLGRGRGTGWPPHLSLGDTLAGDSSRGARDNADACPQGERERDEGRWSPRRVIGFESRRPQGVGDMRGSGGAERPAAAEGASRGGGIDDSLHQVEMYTMRACFAAVLSTAVTPFSQLALVQRCQSNLEGLCVRRSWLDVLAGMPWKTFFLQFAVSLTFLIINSLMAATLHENEVKRKVREANDEEGDDF